MTSRVGRSSVHLARRVPWKLASWPVLKRVLLQVLADHEVGGVLGVALVDDEEMQQLHCDFLGIDTPTDVISFPLGSGNELEHDEVLGEVVVSVDTARREARTRRLPVDREIALYAIHGTLHLVGYDDLEPSRKRVMRQEERRYLRLLAELTSPNRSSPRPVARRLRRKRQPARV